MDAIQRATKIPEGVLKHHIVLRQSPPAPMAFTATSASQSIFLFGIPPKTVITGVIAKLATAFTVVQPTYYTGNFSDQVNIGGTQNYGNWLVTVGGYGANLITNTGFTVYPGNSWLVEIYGETNPLFHDAIGNPPGNATVTVYESTTLQNISTTANLVTKTVGMTDAGGNFSYTGFFPKTPGGNTLTTGQRLYYYFFANGHNINNAGPLLAFQGGGAIPGYLQSCTVTLATVSQLDNTITSSNYYMPSFECTQNVSPTSFMYWSPWSMYSTDPQDLRAVFTATGGNMADIVSGEVEFTVMYQLL
jgi:hypothetical protein